MAQAGLNRRSPRRLVVVERDHQMDLPLCRGSFSRSIGVVLAGGKADAVTMAHLDSSVK
jgi:hypothetical protein